MARGTLGFTLIERTGKLNGGWRREGASSSGRRARYECQLRRAEQQKHFKSGQVTQTRNPSSLYVRPLPISCAKLLDLYDIDVTMEAWLNQCVICKMLKPTEIATAGAYHAWAMC
jgi:hypothetical protein